MALDKSALKASIKSIMESSGNDAESVATALANAIDTYVRGAEVTVTALPEEIQVQGTASAQMNMSAISLKGGDSSHTGGLS